MNKEVFFQDLGEVPYETCWNFQEGVMQYIIEQKRQAKTTSNYLLFVSHPHVITLGKNANQKHLLVSKPWLESKKISYIRTNRGGDITYHGPGQLVVYPIFDLENFKPDIHLYLRNLEEVIIRVLRTYEIEGFRKKGETGVWVTLPITQQPAKICAMGVRTSRWVSMHGLALNANTDLSFFDLIIPCGIRDKRVTSLEGILKSQIDLMELKQRVCEAFEHIFEAIVIPWREYPKFHS